MGRGWPEAAISPSPQGPGVVTPRSHDVDVEVGQGAPGVACGTGWPGPDYCSDVRVLETDVAAMEDLAASDVLNQLSLSGNNRITQIRNLDAGGADVTVRNNANLREVAVKMAGGTLSVDGSVQELALEVEGDGDAKAILELRSGASSALSATITGAGNATLVIVGVPETVEIQRSNLGTLEYSVDGVPAGMDVAWLIDLGVPERATFFRYAGGATLDDFSPLVAFLTANGFDGEATLCDRDADPELCEDLVQ
jgi:hypothetical protein